MRSVQDIQTDRSIAKEKLKKAKKLADSDPTSQKWKDEVDSLNKKINDLVLEEEKLKRTIKEEKFRKEREEQEQYNATVASMILEKINEFDIKQIIGKKQYLVNVNGEYRFRDLTQLNREIFRFGNRTQENIFHSLMEQEQRNYEDYTFTFLEVPQGFFNMAGGIREKWIKPVPYDGIVKTYKCPEGIDLMLTSLSGGNQEIRDHIEECIVRKYRHPGDYRIPNLLMFGEGGVCKNEFNTYFLGTIFKDSCAVTSFKVLTENPACLLGKVCVLVDETIDSKADYDKFKGIAGNQNIPFKKLYSDAGTIPNIMWLCVSGQGNSGPLSISEDSTTRRISAINYVRDLFYWISQRKKEIYTKDQEGKYKAEWETILKRDFTDETLSIWLGWACAKFKEDRPIAAYHGEAFDRMIDAHKGPLEYLIDNVILANYKGKPNGFTIDDLFLLYKQITTTYYSGRTTFGRNKFIAELKSRIDRKKVLGWKYEERQYWKKGNDTGQMLMIVPENQTGQLVRNFDPNVFLMKDHNDRITGLTEWLANTRTDSRDNFAKVLQVSK